RIRLKREAGQQALLERGARETLRAQWRFNQALGFPSAQVPDTPGMPGPGAAWGAGVAARMAAAQTRQAQTQAEALPGMREWLAARGRGRHPAPTPGGTPFGMVRLPDGTLAVPTGGFAGAGGGGAPEGGMPARRAAVRPPARGSPEWLAERGLVRVPAGTPRGQMSGEPSGEPPGPGAGGGAGGGGAGGGGAGAGPGTGAGAGAGGGGRGAGVTVPGGPVYVTGTPVTVPGNRGGGGGGGGRTGAGTRTGAGGA